MTETIPAQWRAKRTIKWSNDPVKRWEANILCRILKWDFCNA